MSERVSTRDAFARALAEVGAEDQRIVAVAADSQSRYGSFARDFPERNINVGIAEQNMIGIAAGLALEGKIALVTAYATFLSMRCLEQVRTDVAYERLNVKLVGTDAGFSSGYLGFTHQALEDIGIMRSIPNMVIIDPADAGETYLATRAMLEWEGPVYLRIRGRAAEPLISWPDNEFRIGKGRILREGHDATIITCGRPLHEVLRAVKELDRQGISVRVIHLPTVKPIDREMLIRAARETGRLITVEEHSITGGLGSAVAEVVSEQCPCLVYRLGVPDVFGLPGHEAELARYFGLTGPQIAEKVRQVLKRN